MSLIHLHIWTKALTVIDDDTAEPRIGIVAPPLPSKILCLPLSSTLRSHSRLVLVCILLCLRSYHSMTPATLTTCLFFLDYIISRVPRASRHRGIEVFLLRFESGGVNVPVYLYPMFPRKDHMYPRCSHTGRTHSIVSLHLISFDFHLVMRDAHSYRSGILYGQDGKHLSIRTRPKTRLTPVTVLVLVFPDSSQITQAIQ